MTALSPSTAKVALARRVAVTVADVRRTGNRLDSREVRMARRLLIATRRRELSAVYLGDSALSFTSPADHDGRKLWRMVSDALGGSRQVVALHGSSYHSALYTEYVHLLAATGARPVLILPLCVRVHVLPWAEHPKLGYRDAVGYLRTRPDGVRPWQLRLSVPEPGAARFGQFYARDFPTVAGRRPIGDYVKPLRAPEQHGLTEDERVSLLYAYHHGGEVDPIAVSTVVELGRAVRASGCPVVVYETPIPVEFGAQLWGERLRALAQRNLAALRAAFTEGYGADPGILRTGTHLGTSAFIDPHDGSEHMNETGRSWLSAQIEAAAVSLR